MVAPQGFRGRKALPLQEIPILGINEDDNTSFPAPEFTESLHQYINTKREKGGKSIWILCFR
jgi:hypothetical protein